MVCYFCKSKSNHFIDKNGFAIYVCPVCGLGQTQLGIPYEQFVEEYYVKGYFSGETNKVAYVDYGRDKPLIVKNMSHVLDELVRVVSAGKLLDVGCAYGYFMELAKARGFDPYGIEPSAHAGSQAQKLLGKKKVQMGRLDETSFSSGSMDVVSLLDVFEHLGDPRAALKQINALLKPGGYTMIATGDSRSLLPRILKRRWTFYIPPQHLFFFHRDLMAALLREAGFEPVKVFSVGKWLSVEYVLHLAQTTGESKIAAVLMKLCRAIGVASFPIYIPSHDNMIFIAKKVEKP